MTARFPTRPRLPSSLASVLVAAALLALAGGAEAKNYKCMGKWDGDAMTCTGVTLEGGDVVCNGVMDFGTYPYKCGPYKTAEGPGNGGVAACGFYPTAAGGREVRCQGDVLVVLPPNGNLVSDPALRSTCLAGPDVEAGPLGCHEVGDGDVVLVVDVPVLLACHALGPECAGA